jgi:hypothetical protein
VQLGLRAPHAEAEVFGSALGIEAGGDRDGLDEGGLASAIVAHENLGASLRVLRLRTQGIENGYRSKDLTRSRRRETETR